MKLEKDPKYNTYALFALIVTAFAGIAISLVIHFSAVSEFLKKALSVLSPLFYAAIIMLIVSPFTDFLAPRIKKALDKRRVKNAEKRSRGLAIAISYLALVCVIILAVVIIIPQFTELYNFVISMKDYTAILDKLGEILIGKSEIIGERYLSLIERLKASISDSLTQMTALIPRILEAFRTVVSGLSSILIGFIISVYAMLDRKRLKALARKTLTALFPSNATAGIQRASKKLYVNSVAFFSSRALNSLILGTVFYFILLLLGVRFHAVICLIIAICGFVPIFGIFVGGAVSTLIVVVTNTGLTGWFAMIYIAVMMLDVVLVSSKFFGKIGMRIGTYAVCIMLGYFLLGMLGAVLTVPICETAKFFIVEWLEKRSGNQ